MNTKNKTVTVSFIAGALLAAVAVYLLLRASLPSVQALRCDVQPNEFINISGFEVKILDTDVKLTRSRKGETPQPRTASLQWRCDVKNTSTVAVRYDLKTELLDKDAFVLATATVDSQYGQGDLSAGRTHSVHDDIVMEYSRSKTIASSRVTPKALKTNAQIEQERQEQLARQWQTAQAAQAEQQKRVDGEKEKWMKLKRGMSKVEVETLLGKPASIKPFKYGEDWWEYPSVNASKYSAPYVEFSAGGVVTGWEAP